MNPLLYRLATGLFIALTLGLVVLVYRLVWQALVGTAAAARRRAGLVVAALAGWLALLTGAALSGALLHWQALPPRLAPVLGVPLVVIGWLAWSPAAGRGLARLSAGLLIGAQSFRVLMEVILWLLLRAGVVPVQMTFEGRNFDMLVGLTAPLVATVGLRRWPRWALVVWHIASLGLLANIVGVALLSTPSPFRMFLNEPANTIIAHWPFVWLPGFVVPMALALHVLSLRQLFATSPTLAVASAAPAHG